MIGLAGVRLALIPDGALDGIARERRDHAVVKYGRAAVTAGRGGGLRRRLREGLPFGTSLASRFEIFLEVGDILVRRLGIVFNSPRELLGDPFQLRIGFQRALAGPGLGRGAAHRGVNHADRHAESLLKVAAEVVGHRREIGDRLGTAFRPLALDVSCRFNGGPHGHREEPELIVRRVGRHLLGVGGELQRPPHVRLPAGDPHLADQHVLDLNGVVAGDGERERPPRVAGFDADLPAAVLRGGLSLLVAEFDGDLLTVGSRAPDRRFRASLKDHVVGEQAVRLDIGTGGSRNAGEPSQHAGDEERFPVHCRSPRGDILSGRAHKIPAGRAAARRNPIFDAKHRGPSGACWIIRGRTRAGHCRGKACAAHLPRVRGRCSSALRPIVCRSPRACTRASRRRT